MHLSHKVRIAIALIVVLLLALLIPRLGGAQTAAFGDLTVRYSAISTDQLFGDAAGRYGIERSPRNGLVNIAVERRRGDGTSDSVAAVVSGKVADLTGHARPLRFRETREAGAYDYLGEFAVDASGTYVFTIDVALPGQAAPHRVTFNRDYVVD